jgi:Protein of unknown function (DUF3237)
MKLQSVFAIGALLAAPGVLAGEQPGPSASAPGLDYVFSVRATLAPPLEVGATDGGRRRFIAITGGEVYGPRLKGKVLAAGGDWQTILPGGLARIEARYFLKAEDGTVIEVTNPGVRSASPEVTERLARGDKVDPAQYYFRTTPSFKVAGEALGWMERTVFVARGIRNPDSVTIDFYAVN